LYYIRDTISGIMQDKMISFRLDREAIRALRVLTEEGRTQSEAIRTALLEAAAHRDRSALAAEAAALAEDEADRREIAEVAALMESLRAEG
jgi:Arc/MetJ-type ribon-helix-helix transcriptional regulator